MQNGKQTLNNVGSLGTKTTVSGKSDRRGLCGKGASSSFPATGALVLGVPVLLLALDGAVGRVPAAVVHGLLLTVVALRATDQDRFTGSRALVKQQTVHVLLERSDSNSRHKNTVFYAPSGMAGTTGSEAAARGQVPEVPTHLHAVINK